MKIDAHLHLWRRARGDYHWLTPALGALWRDFEAHDAHEILAANRIESAVLVQAAPTVAETLFLLDVAAQSPWVAGVVGWVDLTDPNVGQTLPQLSENSSLRGVRPMVQDEPDDAWLLRDDVASGLDAVSEAGLVFDALVRPQHLAALYTVMARHPNLACVLDHGGKPNLAGDDLTLWVRDIIAIATLPNVVCKLSGLVTECGTSWTLSQLHRAFDVLLEAFGPERLIWGSDWPVCTSVATYGEWLKATDQLVARLSSTEQSAIYGDNAQRVYRLNEGRA